MRDKTHPDLIEDWKNNHIHQSTQRKEFLYNLPTRDHQEIGKLVREHHGEVFSEIDCLDCANCCKTTPPIYTNKDVKRIAAYLKTTPKQFKKKYTIEDVNGELIGIKVPCSFLNEDNTCAVYEVRPLACRTYPHTDDAAFAERPELNFNNTIVCPAAFHIVKRLQSQING
jgi:hypothetical protein